MKFYNLRCEVPGTLGTETIYDKSSVPWRMNRPHVIFDGWLGAELITIASCLFVTDSLMKKMLFEYTGIQGYETFFSEVSGAFTSLHPKLTLPDFKWMKVGANVFADDIALGRHKNLYNQLIISDRFWQILSDLNLGDYSLSPAAPDSSQSS